MIAFFPRALCLTSDSSRSRHIHIIWYVINDAVHRTEDNDREIIQSIKKMNIPVMIDLNKGSPEQKTRMETFMNGTSIENVKIPDLNTILKLL